MAASALRKKALSDGIPVPVTEELELRKVSVRLPQNLFDQYKEQADFWGQPVSELIRRAMVIALPANGPDDLIIGRDSNGAPLARRRSAFDPPMPMPVEITEEEPVPLGRINLSRPA